MTTIKLKNGSGAPADGDLVQGEPALDLTNKRLYTEDSGGSVIEVGTNPGVDVTFADNRKAIFGAGSDLQIYHDGSNSFIRDAGTGNLVIRGTNLNLQKDGGESYITMVADGAVTLFHDNSARLATTSTGIDVTGTALAHEIEIGDGSAGGTSEILFSDNVSARGKILYDHSSNPETMLLQTTGTTAISIDNSQNVSMPNGNLDVTGTVVSDGVQSTDGDIKVTTSGSFVGFNSQRAGVPSSGGYQLGRLNFDAYSTGTTFVSGASIQSFSDGAAWTSSSTPAYLSLQTTPSGSTSLKERLKIANNGDVSFYEDTGTTAKFFWDASAERLGIGTSSPATKLEVTGTGDAETGVTTTHTRSGVGYTLILDNLTNAANNGSGVKWRSGGFDTGAIITRSDSTAASNDAPAFMTFHTSDDGTENLAERMRIDSAGRVGIGTSSPSYPLTVDGYIGVRGGNGITFLNPSNNYTSDIYNGASSGTSDLRFKTQATERMRIDASGNLLVGTTTTNIATEGTVIYGAGNEGVMQLSSTAMTALYVNRSNDGELVQFRVANSAVGSISVASSTTSYNTSSDQRLKDNIVDAPSASDDIDAIQVRSFDWKADGSHQKYGMVAQELQSVAPEAVSGDADSDDMMGVDYSKLVPMLVKEIQSLRARVAQLEGEA